MILYVGKDRELKTIAQGLEKAGQIGRRIKKAGENTEAAACMDTEKTVLRIDPGFYHEKLEIDICGISLEGTGKCPEETVIDYDDYALQMMPDGIKRGTFRSYTVFLDAPYSSLYNLTIRNSAGPGKEKGQAVALYAEGEGIVVNRCRLLGSQDTLFTGPLPEKEVEPGGFRGPKEFAPRVNGRQFYKDCYICGGVDFIFGSATAFFENCVIESLDEGGGYVTAASTPRGQKYGYVFDRCSFIGNEDKTNVYLGRPWREYARTVIMNSYIGGHILPEGWDDWGKAKAHETSFYAEYENYGPGSPGPRADWCRRLSDEEAEEYSKRNVLGSFLY
ncbi:MAG: pectin methylesterase [Parasporobacterium sp.]|nr:pectin methylesterase [Parasporobacterium sp.]